MVKKTVLLILITCALFASGLAVRRAVLNAQYARYGRLLPFDLESALNFRYVRLLVTNGSLPVIDKYIQYPGGVVVRQTYELCAEYICASLARFFPASVRLEERVRWISVAWFCLGIPALVLWLWWWKQSLWGAALAGAYYAFSLASVIRSTGQELSNENFALPLLIAHLATSALAGRKDMRFWAFLGMGSVSAILLAWALMIWDLIQFFVIVWALLGFVRVITGDYFRESRHWIKWCLVLAALMLAGWFDPYLRAHGFVYSPAMLLAYGTALVISADSVARHQAPPERFAQASGVARNSVDFQNRRTSCGATTNPIPFIIDPFHWRTVLLRVGLALLPLVIGTYLGREYMQTYQHFVELIYAKIIFLNVKPADPELLTFNQSILWVPALHSANFLLTKNLFPFMLVLFLISAIIVLSNPRWRIDSEIIELLFFSFMSLIAFVLFVRLHVFAAIGFSASLGLLAIWGINRRNILLRVIVILILLGGAAAEGANVLRDPFRWGSAQPYLKQKLELVKWLKSNAPAEPVLANFGISAFVLAYADCPIILHPKFESPEIRQRVQEYGETLFKADEEQFRSWADKYGTAFYIYSLGEFADVHPDAQMRYCVDALHPPPYAAARLFEFNPPALRWFVLLWQNPKYRVFRVITKADERTAANKAATAQWQIDHGLLKQAKAEAVHALLYDPGNKNAQEAILQIDGLMRKGGGKQ